MKNEKFPSNLKHSGGDFSLKSLRIFLMVEECGSMALAAERLKASPSGISQHISSLERDIGGELFDRNVKPLALTPSGYILKKHATRILDAVGTARSELFEMQLAIPDQLRFAVINDLDATITPILASHVVREFPGCIFKAHSARSDFMTQMLSERKVDIILTADPPSDLDEFEIIPVLSEPFILCCGKGLVDPSLDVVEQLEQLPFIHFDPQMPMGRLVSQHLRRLKMTPPMRFSFDATRSILTMVRDQSGWALVTPLCLLDSVRYRDSLDLHRLPFSGFSRTVYLVARRDELGSLPSRLAALTANLVRQHLIPEIHEILPWCGDLFQLHEGESE